jgi:hypothetical protein
MLIKDILASLVSDFYEGNEFNPVTRATASIYLQRFVTYILNCTKTVKAMYKSSIDSSFSVLIHSLEAYLHIVRSATGHPRDLSRNFTDSSLYQEVQDMPISVVKSNLFKIYRRHQSLSDQALSLIETSLRIPDFEDLYDRPSEELYRILIEAGIDDCPELIDPE